MSDYGIQKTGDGSTDTLEEAVNREGRHGGTTAASPNTRWITVASDPPSLREDETRKVARPIEGGQPWTSRDVLHLSEAKFGVTYHPNYM